MPGIAAIQRVPSHFAESRFSESHFAESLVTSFTESDPHSRIYRSDLPNWKPIIPILTQPNLPIWSLELETNFSDSHIAESHLKMSVNYRNLPVIYW